jgi:hypothetical protein
VADVIGSQPVYSRGNAMHQNQLLSKGQQLPLRRQHLTQVVRVVIHQDRHLLPLQFELPVVSGDKLTTAVLNVEDEIQLILEGVFRLTLLWVFDLFLDQL